MIGKFDTTFLLQSRKLAMIFESEDSDHFLFTQMRLGKEEAFDFIFRKYYKLLTTCSCSGYSPKPCTGLFR